jgi:hypothetical protein
MVSYCYGKLGPLDKVYYVATAERNLISVDYLTPERNVNFVQRF